MSAGLSFKTGGAYGVPLMKFTLTYVGELPPSGNSRKPEDKWAIRQHINPQLEHLWQCHPALEHLREDRFVPAQGPYLWSEAHHSATHVRASRTPQRGDIDLCREIDADGYKFLPIVTTNLALICSLHILFLRQGQVGNVFREDGDLDNRIKTLIDALRAPTTDEVKAARPSEDKSDLIYCLMEDDKLVTGINIETRQLLNRRGASKFDVHLVIDVDVGITHPRKYNQSFLGD
jgi:hypothetical protein